MIREWKKIETAPKDGTSIQARIPGHGEDNIIAWMDDQMIDAHGNPVGGWFFATEQEPPACWTDGVCWASNEDGVSSVQPTHWKEVIVYEIGDRVRVTDPKTRRETIGRVCEVDEKDGAVRVLVKGSRVWVRGDLVGRIEV